MAEGAFSVSQVLCCPLVLQTSGPEHSAPLRSASRQLQRLPPRRGEGAQHRESRADPRPGSAHPLAALPVLPQSVPVEGGPTAADCNAQVLEAVSEERHTGAILRSWFWACTAAVCQHPSSSSLPTTSSLGKDTQPHMLGKQGTPRPWDQTRMGSAGSVRVPAMEHTSPEKEEGKFHLNSLLPLERRRGQKEKHLGFFSPLLVIFKNLSPLKEERGSRSSDTNP